MTRTAGLILALAGIVGGAVVAFVLLRDRDSRGAKPVAASQPSTQPATAPATQPTAAAAKPAPPKTYMDVVFAHYPQFPTTQPLGMPLDLRDGARLIIEDPIYLDPIGHLWITRVDADPTPAVLKRAAKEQVHLTREQVVFVHRWPDERGVWQPQLVCRKPGGGGFELVSLAGRQHIGDDRDYDWTRAFSWNDTFVVPTRGGASVFRPDRRPMELHHELVAADVRDDENLADTQVLLDWRGLLAWIPWDPGKTGSNGAARFIDEKWIALDESAGWPRKIVHLVPLLDGGVLQIVANDDDTNELRLALLDPPAVDEEAIRALVLQLSDRDPDKRLEAFQQLTRYGQGIWPVLEKLHPNQPPEARIRIEQLLSAKIEPRLGGMKLLPGRTRVLARTGGSALLYNDAGVEVNDDQDNADVVAPAWIALVPGRPISLAPADLVADLRPDSFHIDIIRGEFIVTDDVHGPRWWLANHFSEPLLKKAEMGFDHIVGQDARGRWLFRKDRHGYAPTLIIDPTLPDSTPRLPVWRFPVSAGTAGWTREDWPAIKSGGAWVLGESDWRPLDESKEQMISELEEPPPAPATTFPPATNAATIATTNESDPPIFIDKDGTRYCDGRETLRVRKPDGSTITWPLPDQAVGSGDVWLLRAGHDRLFLFNEPGRVLRIKPTPEGPEPFELEATFTRRIPSVDHYQRVWLDPAGRIVIAHEGDTLSILFPTGTIPPAIARKIPAAELRDAEDDD
jgi:hypothetical protein